MKLLLVDFVSRWQWFDIGQWDSNLVGMSYFCQNNALLMPETSPSDLLPDD
ncbi:MAG: hypothetical protein AB7D06_09055 [Pedobacter sp.]